MRISKLLKNLIRPAAFLLVFALLCVALQFVLVPSNGSSQRMWSELREYDDVNLVYIGSSYSEKAFNPYIVDEIAGTVSFNMSTPDQGLGVAYVGLKTAIETEPIDTAVITVNAYTVGTETNTNACMTYLYSRKYGMNLFERLQADYEFVTDKEYFDNESSINFFFPWVYNEVAWNKDALTENLKIKLGLDIHHSDNIGYGGRGYEYNTDQLSYADSATEMNSSIFGLTHGTENAYEYLDKICALCQENDVNLILLNTPHAIYDVYAMGEDTYFTINDEIQSVCDGYGITYYDFNLVKPELFEIKEEYFADFEHLNKEGSEVFSAAFAKFYEDYKAGKDVSAYFYDRQSYREAVYDEAMYWLSGQGTADAAD